MFLFYSKSPLPAFHTETYRGMAFDGRRYYMSVRCENSMAVFDRDFRFIENIATHRPYKSLCYDCARDCFWALSDTARFMMLRLDRGFRETGSLVPCAEDDSALPLSGVSFCRESGRLLVSCGNRLLEADASGGAARLLLQERKGSLILAAARFQEYIVCSVLRASAEYFVLAAQDGSILFEEKLPQTPLVNAILQEEQDGLLMLSNRQDCPQQLFRVRLGYDEPKDICPAPFGSALEEPAQEVPDDWSAVLNSVALEQAAIAGILEAEAERMRKAVRKAARACELTEINDSVQRTIMHAARLELSLLSKLELCCPGKAQAPQTLPSQPETQPFSPPGTEEPNL